MPEGHAMGAMMNTWETLAVIGVVYILVFVAHRAT
jgi:hypothetical protein